jgi:large repetitive protein
VNHDLMGCSMYRFFSVAFLFACAEEPKVETDPLTEEGELLADNDGDGYLSDEDCDDSNDTINPGAQEICDGFDNNCDNQADEGVTESFYADSDSDGFGNGEITTEACSAPSGFVSNGSDCDDTDQDSYPSAEELCDERDNDCNGEIDDGIGVEFYEDGDGDGFGDDLNLVEACDLRIGLSAVGGDCDDGNGAVSPAADELCDGIDNDCNGETDEGSALVFYADTDEDGYGDEGETAESCSQPEGYVSQGGDCDDLDSLSYPGAIEFCDQQDNDCNGIDDDGAIDATSFYWDSDGDGYGQASTTEIACTAPTSFVDNDEDCDDGDDDVSPSAPELCNGSDDDCDGDIDENGEGGPLWHLDGDGDGYGDAGDSVSACSQPDGYLEDGSDCDDNDDDINPASEELCNGEDDDCDGVVDGAGSVDAGSWYTDADGDGFGGGEAFVSCGTGDGLSDQPGDCDDGNGSIHPEAEELCNGEDDDCDGEFDVDASDATLWYADGDGDGYGDLGDTLESCSQPAGYSEDGSDCDDDNNTIGPEAEELCNGLDDDCDGESDEEASDAPMWYEDGDGDGSGAGPAVPSCEQPGGHSADAEDCDDDNNTIGPEAEELCNGVDDDCDDAVDGADAADAEVWYLDADGDGYGDSGSPMATCQPLDGYSSLDGDCDDGDGGKSPAATEVCDGEDNDCSGEADESTASDAMLWYVDADGDGFGSGDPISSCDGASGYSLSDGDCDDGSPAAAPDEEESCNDVDDDCDGDVDEDDALDAHVWYSDGDEDGYGDSSEVAMACSQPEGHAAAGGDCDDNDNDQSPGVEEICNGIDDDCDEEIDEADAVATDTWYTDGDGDGFGGMGSGVEACDQPDGMILAGGDCDDGDIAVGPAAEELCDGIDNDCDGTADGDDALDPEIWYLDFDIDGYGDPDVSTAACDAPDGYVGTADDCDDALAEINPEAGCGSSCLDIFEIGLEADGFYTIDTDGYGTGSDPFEVYCDMATEGGGWTLIDIDYLRLYATLDIQSNSSVQSGFVNGDTVFYSYPDSYDYEAWNDFDIGIDYTEIRGVVDFYASAGDISGWTTSGAHPDNGDYGIQSDTDYSTLDTGGTGGNKSWHRWGKPGQVFHAYSGLGWTSEWYGMHTLSFGTIPTVAGSVIRFSSFSESGDSSRERWAFAPTVYVR